jgi:hypothetical protein
MLPLPVGLTMDLGRLDRPGRKCRALAHAGDGPARISRFGRGGRASYIRGMQSKPGPMPIGIAARHDKTAEARPSRAGALLFGIGGLALVATGALLWWRNGAAIFTDTVLAALAWCF